MTSHRERVAVLKGLLEICHKNGWTYDTKAIADRLAPAVQQLGFAPVTVKSIVASAVDLLLIEKKTGKPWSDAA